jgi:EmrB/QacA subfamily drug resistance transporter
MKIEQTVKKTTTPQIASNVQTTNQIIGQRRWFALAAVMLIMFFSSLDQTVVATAMPVIIGDLQGFSLYAWVFTAYMMASAVTVPIYGKLSDIYGRKPFYVLGVGMFMLGSMAAGMVHTMGQLIAARTFQGLGAGAMLTMPRATVGDIFNPRERGRWMGVISSIFGIASIIGPALGGWITDQWNWRWIFYINLPVAAIALIGIVMTLPTVRTEKQPKVDWLGSLLLIFGLMPMLLAFTWAGSSYPWGSPVIIGLFAVSTLFMALFVLAERKAEEPILAPELFKNRIFSSTALVALFISMGMFGSIAFLPGADSEDVEFHRREHPWRAIGDAYRALQVAGGDRRFDRRVRYVPDDAFECQHIYGRHCDRYDCPGCGNWRRVAGTNGGGGQCLSV